MDCPDIEAACVKLQRKLGNDLSKPEQLVALVVRFPSLGNESFRASCAGESEIVERAAKRLCASPQSN